MPYVASALFVGGVAYRIVLWTRLQQPGKLTLYPTQGWSFGSAVKEALCFPGLFRGDRGLWLLAWTFHAALALACIGHFRVITRYIDSTLSALGLGVAGIDQLSATAGAFAGIVLLVSAGGLFLRRTLLQRAREVSSSPDFLALLLLLAVIGTGNVMRFGSTPVDLNETRAWARSLLTLSPEVPANSRLLLHLACAEALLVYLPVSKLMHWGGLFFTMPLIRRS